MYLRVKHFIWGDNSDKKKEEIKRIFPVFATLDPTHVEFELGYWRKANQIHKWFVDNVQGGTDDCGTYPVSAEQLQQLRDLCIAALDLHEAGKDEEGSELIPPTEGFFFGGTAIDDYYWEDLKHTVEVINQIEFDVKDPAKKLVDKIQGAKIPVDECEFEYHSSW